MEWVDLLGWETQYEICRAGLVRSKKRLVKSKGNHYRTVNPKILSLIPLNDYRVVCLSKNGKTSVVGIHILVATQFVPNPLNKAEVNHKDGDKANNWDWNLEWTTHQENMSHAYANKLVNSTGSSNPMAKVTDAVVLEIREKFSNGSKQCDLCKEYGLGATAIHQIIKRKTWNHI